MTTTVVIIATQSNSPLRGQVQFLTGGIAREPFILRCWADPMKFRGRRSQSGWEQGRQAPTRSRLIWRVRSVGVAVLRRGQVALNNRRTMKAALEAAAHVRTRTCQRNEQQSPERGLHRPVLSRRLRPHHQLQTARPPRPTGSEVRAFFDLDLIDRWVLYAAPALFTGGKAVPMIAGPSAASIDALWRGRFGDVRRLGADLRIDLIPTNRNTP